MLEGEPHGFATDIWSLGCVLYEMLAGKPAFSAPSYPAVVYRITQGQYEPLSAAVSSEAVELIASMLQKDPENRPNIAKVLQSSWLQPLKVLEVDKEETGIDCSAGHPIEISHQSEANTPTENSDSS